MSRAYRIKVSETLSRIIHTEDHVSTQLEVLEVLPAEEMSELLEQELIKRGFEDKDGKLSRTKDGVTVTIETETGVVTVQSEACDDVELEAEKGGYVYEGTGRKQAEQTLRSEVKEDLEKQASRKEAELQKEATDKLEGELMDLRKELDQALNRVTAEALKRKAARIGQIKEVTEDPEGESLTIVVEV